MYKTTKNEVEEIAAAEKDLKTIAKRFMGGVEACVKLGMRGRRSSRGGQVPWAELEARGVGKIELPVELRGTGGGRRYVVLVSAVERARLAQRAESVAPSGASFVTVENAAARLGVPTSAVRNMISDGRFSRDQRGVPLEEVMAMIKNNREFLSKLRIAPTAGSEGRGNGSTEGSKTESPLLQPWRMEALKTEDLGRKQEEFNRQLLEIVRAEKLKQEERDRKQEALNASLLQALEVIDRRNGDLSRSIAGLLTPSDTENKPEEQVNAAVSRGT